MIEQNSFIFLLLLIFSQHKLYDVSSPNTQSVLSESPQVEGLNVCVCTECGICNVCVVFIFCYRWIHLVHKRLTACFLCMVLAPSAAPNGKVLLLYFVAEQSSSQPSFFEYSILAGMQV